MEIEDTFGCRDQEPGNTFGSSLVPKLSIMCIKKGSGVLSDILEELQSDCRKRYHGISNRLSYIK